MSGIATSTPGANNVPQADGSGKIDMGWISTVTVLDGDSDGDIPTTKTVKTAVDGKEPTLTKGNLVGTSNQIVVSGSGTNALIGSGVILSTPQDIHSGASPTFASLVLSTIPVYLSNALAITGGLSAGMLYRTGLDPDTLCIVH